MYLCYGFWISRSPKVKPKHNRVLHANIQGTENYGGEALLYQWFHFARSNILKADSGGRTA